MLHFLLSAILLNEIFTINMNCAAKLRFLSGSNCQRTIVIKILFSFFFIANVFSTEGKPTSTPFPLVYFAAYEIEIHSKWNGKTWEELLFIRDIAELKRELSGNKAFKVLRIINDEGIYRVVYKDDTGIEKEVSFFECKQLLLKVEVSKDASCPEIDYDLMQSNYLDSLNFMRTNKIVLDLSDFPCAASIDLDSWKQFDDIKPGLKEFNLKTAQNIAFNSNALLGCNNLRELEIPFHFGASLDVFEALERLTMPGIASTFAHQIASLPNLTELQEVSSLYSNQFETLHAERYFEVLLENKRAGRPFRTTRLNELCTAIQLDLPNKWTENGEILVLENELLGYAPGSVRNDTLLHGRMKNGKRKGVWTVKFVDQYARNDWEKHQFDFNKKQKVKLPKNGAWKLKYVNKSTAIEGSLEQGLKVGEWRFYNEDGSLRTQRFYENDTLKRTIVHLQIDGLMCESRTFYFSEWACVQSFSNASQVFFTYIDVNTALDPVIVDVHHINILNDSKTGYRKIKKGSVEYESAIRTHFINYLYPELKGAVLPFSF